ncbi:putative sister chromatid cohesion protein Pds5 [Helianthus anomalus]
MWLLKVEKLLSKVDRSPKRSMIDALRPSMRALIKDVLSKHSDVDVKVAVVSCISEITRITAPDAPYDDNQMRLIVSTFEGLADQSSRSYAKRASILETSSKVRSCVIMLDLECDALIVEMFEHFLKSVRDYHLDSVFPLMGSIMVLVIEESEEIPVEMLKPLLARVKKDNTPYLLPAVTALGESLDMYTKVVTAVCKGTAATNETNDENTYGLQRGMIILLYIV